MKRKITNALAIKIQIKQRFQMMIRKRVRWPGIEPGSNAWKASMLTITPPTLTLPSPKILFYTLKPI